MNFEQREKVYRSIQKLEGLWMFLMGKMQKQRTVYTGSRGVGYDAKRN